MKENISFLKDEIDDFVEEEFPQNYGTFLKVIKKSKEIIKKMV